MTLDRLETKMEVLNDTFRDLLNDEYANPQQLAWLWSAFTRQLGEVVEAAHLDYVQTKEESKA